jgi:hypothetical protein
MRWTNDLARFFGVVDKFAEQAKKLLFLGERMLS